MGLKINDDLDAQAQSIHAHHFEPKQSVLKVNPSQVVMKLIHEACLRFKLIEKGDKVAVACSGGKDSLMMIVALLALQRRADYDFELQVIHLDQHQPGFQRAQFNATLELLGVHCEIISKDTWSVVEQQLNPGQIPCAVCGRLRRGILNQWCADHGFNKLALGHHLDDALETFMLNLLFGRRIDPLKPLTPASDLPVSTIRPCLLIEERKIIAWLNQSGLAAIPCPVCDSFPDAKRRDLKTLLQGLGDAQPELYASVREAVYGERSVLDFSFGERGSNRS
ncbi:MAG: tRNA 2-thiocytidine(32) synthetase TtcA [Myxococcales bacterium]|nr:tRNA 2-thiocytidine(32) synthetase TtcA [Myxococcales bacterium]